MRETTTRHLGRARGLQIASFSIVKAQCVLVQPLSEGERNPEKATCRHEATVKIIDRRRRNKERERDKSPTEERQRPAHFSEEEGRERKV